MGINEINSLLSNHAPYGAPKVKNETKAKKAENENAAASRAKGTDATQTGAAVQNGGTEGTGVKIRTAAEYTQYLQKQFSYMNKSATMEGVPTSVSVSPAFIAKCANDPEKAQFLEENLAALPGCAKLAVSWCAGTLTNLSYNFDANGNISVLISGSSDPDGKIAKENAERKARENREKAEKAEKDREIKRTEEKAAAEELTEKLMAKIKVKLASSDYEGTDVTGGVEQFTASETAPAPNWAIKSGDINIKT